MKSSRHATILLAICLLALHAMLAVRSMGLTSPTVDEVTSIRAGYAILRTADFRHAGNHPMLLRVWHGLPLLTLTELNLPNDDQPGVAAWRKGFDFFAANASQVDTIVFRSRLGIVLLSIALGILVFWWSRELYGNSGALIALLLYTLSPNVLAHATLATTDMGFAFFTFLTIYLFWQLTMRPRMALLIAAGISLGFTLMTKANAPIVIIILALLGVSVFRSDVGYWPIVGKRINDTWLRRAFSFLISFTIVLGIAWLVVNLAYGFRGTFMLLEQQVPRFNSFVPPLNELGAIPVPFPQQFFVALWQQLNHANDGHTAYLFGQVSESGWPYYHAVTFLLKVPIPMMILLGWAVFYSVRHRKENGLVSTAELFLLIPAISTFVIMSLFGIKIGFRHLLPMMPFLYVYISKLGLSFGFQRPWFKVSMTLLSVWYIGASLSIYPHYLSYFNKLGGGPDNGYRYLVDSNIDWGQDLKGLGMYMRENQIDRVYLSYFGSADPVNYDIDYSYLPSVGLRPDTSDGLWWYEEGYEEVCKPVKGIVAISVTNLQGTLLRNHECFSWLHDRQPIDKVGYSIFIYDTHDSFE